MDTTTQGSPTTVSMAATTESITSTNQMNTNDAVSSSVSSSGTTLSTDNSTPGPTITTVKDNGMDTDTTVNSISSTVVSTPAGVTKGVTDSMNGSETIEMSVSVDSTRLEITHTTQDTRTTTQELSIGTSEPSDSSTLGEPKGISRIATSMTQAEGTSEEATTIRKIESTSETMISMSQVESTSQKGGSHIEADGTSTSVETSTSTKAETASPPEASTDTTKLEITTNTDQPVTTSQAKSTSEITTNRDQAENTSTEGSSLTLAENTSTSVEVSISTEAETTSTPVVETTTSTEQPVTTSSTQPDTTTAKHSTSQEDTPATTIKSSISSARSSTASVPVTTQGLTSTKGSGVVTTEPLFGQSTTEDGGLAKGAVIGIAVGVSIAVLILLIIVIFIVLHYRKHKATQAKREKLKQYEESDLLHRTPAPNNNDNFSKGENVSKRYFDNTDAAWDTTGIPGVDNPMYSNDTATNGFTPGGAESHWVNENHDTGSGDNAQRRNTDHAKRALMADSRESVGLLDMGEQDMSTSATYNKLYAQPTTFGKSAPDAAKVDDANDVEEKPGKEIILEQVEEEKPSTDESGKLVIDAGDNDAKVPEMSENEILLEEKQDPISRDDEKTTEL